MKYLETFNLEINSYDIIVCVMPLPQFATKLSISENDVKRFIAEQADKKSVPVIISKVGNKVNLKEDGTEKDPKVDIILKREDYVFIDRDHISQGLAIKFDEDPKMIYKNAYIVSSFGVKARIIHIEEFEKEFEEIIEKIEANVKEKENK